jgi:hypothetical protein
MATPDIPFAVTKCGVTANNMGSSDQFGGASGISGDQFSRYDTMLILL